MSPGDSGVDISDVELTKNEHIHDPSCGDTFDTTAGVTYMLLFVPFSIRGVNSRREGRREGQPLSPSLPPGVDSSDAKMSINEHCMTPRVGSKVTPQLGSHIC